ALRTNTICLPLGEKRGLSLKPLRVSRRTCDPSSRIRYMSLRRQKTILRPSGEKLGPALTVSACVSCRLWLPSSCTAQICSKSPLRSLWNAIVRPPGANAGQQSCAPVWGIRRKRVPAVWVTKIPRPAWDSKRWKATRSPSAENDGAKSRSEEHTSELQSLAYLVC